VITHNLIFGLYIVDMSDTEDYICPVEVEDLQAAEQYSTSKPAPVVSEFVDVANLVMFENGISRKPENVEDSLKLYHLLKNTLE